MRVGMKDEIDIGAFRSELANRGGDRLQSFAPASRRWQVTRSAASAAVGSRRRQRRIDRKHGVDAGVAGDVDVAAQRAPRGGWPRKSRSVRRAARRRRRSRSDIPLRARAASGSWVRSPASTCATRDPRGEARERRARARSTCRPGPRASRADRRSSGRSAAVTAPDVAVRVLLAGAVQPFRAKCAEPETRADRALDAGR